MQRNFHEAEHSSSVILAQGDVLQTARRRQGHAQQTYRGHVFVSVDRTSSAISKFALVFPHGGAKKKAVLLRPQPSRERLT
jgi:hypothetical protein